MPELFLEIGTEEIPSRFIVPALDYLKKETSLFFREGVFVIARERIPQRQVCDRMADQVFSVRYLSCSNCRLDSDFWKLVLDQF